MPMNTRWGVAHAPIDAGRTVLLARVPWPRAETSEPVPLHRTPENPLPLETPNDVGVLAGREDVSLDASLARLGSSNGIVGAGARPT